MEATPCFCGPVYLFILLVLRGPYLEMLAREGVAMSLFEIKCPLCKGTLWIDPASGKVVDHQSADHKKGDFDEFVKNRQKGVAWDDRMQKAKDEESRRKAEIEEKFKKAKDDKEAGPPGEGVMKSPLDWD
jgi:hypothetical protein